jgi:hypothetical protein
MIALDLLAGGGLVAIGTLIGRFLPARKRAPRPPEPVCGCDHHRSYHEGGSGACHHVEREYQGYVYDPPYAEVPCTCQVYTGPEPLGSYYMPEITP